MKYFSTIFVLLCCLLLSLPAALAQRGGGKGKRGQGKRPDVLIKGKVIDGAEGTPLDYATITIFSKRDSAMVTGGITDEKGKFEIETKLGRYFAKVEFLSFQTRVIEAISFGEDQIAVDLGTIALVADSETLAEVEVRAERSQMEMSLDKRVFNVGKDLANTGASAQDILDNVPSVAVDVDGNVSLRGSENVRILIDGKPSGLVGVDNANGLRSLPSNMISKVEVITNPSSRYEAEGMTGIINIVLKKDKKKGINGAFDFTVGQPDNYGVGVNLNFRREKVNFFVNYGLSYRKRKGGGLIYQERTGRDTTLIQDQRRNSDRGGWSNTVRFGADYYINKQNTLTTSFLYRKSDEDNFGSLLYKDYFFEFSPNNLQAITERTDDEKEDEKAIQYAVNYKRTFNKKGQELTATAQFEEDSEVESSAYLEKYFNETYLPTGDADLVQASDNTEGEKQWLFQLDYVNPIGKDGKFEIGLRSSIRDIENDYEINELDDNVWQPVTDVTGKPLSNNFQYDEDIHAIYAIIGNKKGKFSYQFGLRGEHSHVVTQLIETREVNDRSYFNLFPSAHLTYQLSEADAFQLSYSRRIQRPRFWYLNPFFSFSDSRNQRRGNPNLDPELTHSLELGHIKYFDKGTISSSVYYRYSEGTIERSVREVLADNTTLSEPQNLKDEHAYGLEFTISYNPFKWWRINSDLNFYRAITEGTKEQNLSSDTYTMQGRATSRITLWKNTDVQLRTSYRAPRNTTQGNRRATFSTDLGISRDVLKKKATLTLSVRDIFNTRRYNYETFLDDFYLRGQHYWQSRTASLTFNYRLNQKKGRGGNRGNRGGGGGEGEF